MRYSISDYIHYIIASKIEKNSSILDMGGKGKMKLWHDVENANIIDGVDATNLSFEDNDFDVTISIATLEHVGDHDKQNKFIQEAIRVCKYKSIHWFPINQDFENFMNFLGHDHKCIVPDIEKLSFQIKSYEQSCTYLITIPEQAFGLSTLYPKLNCKELFEYIIQNRNKYYGILLEINKEKS